MAHQFYAGEPFLSLNILQSEINFKKKFILQDIFGLLANI